MCGAKLLKEKMIELGALSSLMSGSGPSVFGIFKDEETAKKACLELRQQNVDAFYSTSV